MQWAMLIDNGMALYTLPTAQVSTTLHDVLSLGAWISGSGTTFGWLQDVMVMYM